MRRGTAVIALAILLSACAPGGTPIASRSPSPAVQPSPTPVVTPLNVTNATATIFFRDAAAFDQVDGMTWEGVVGKAPGTIPDYHRANPSETLFGTPTEIRDRNNALVATGNFGAKSFSATWADDDVHYCLIQPFSFLGANGVPATLMIGSAEGGMASVVQVGRIYEQVATYVASCSFEGDRAVVVQSGGQGIGVAQYWVVQVSSGRLLWTRSFTYPNAPISVVASHDSRYIAENYDAGSGLQSSKVYDASGAQLKEFDAGVVAINWNGTAVVLAGRLGGGPPAVATFEGHVLWTAPAQPGMYVWSTKSEPRGTRLAIAIGNQRTSFASATWKGLPAVDLYVVGPEGRVVKSLQGIYW